MHEPNFFAIQDSTMRTTCSAHLRFPGNGNKNVGCLYKTVEEIPKQNFLFKNTEITQCIAEENSDIELFGPFCNQGGRGLQPSKPPQNRNKKKNTDFVDMMVSNVLHDLPFRRNKPLKSTHV
jgi:hypothetical protein